MSDLHLGHKAIALLRGFADIDEYNEEVIRRWNSVVTKRCLIFLLGDATMENKKYIPLLARLNGRIVMVGGNHEDFHDFKLISQYVEAIMGAIQYKGFILTHIPIHTQEVSRFRGNIHGHLHEDTIKKTAATYNENFKSERPYTVTIADTIDKRYLNVSWDRLDGYPISLEKVIKYFTK
jgi:calcineurin-like phosphoesterase family protein